MNCTRPVKSSLKSSGKKKTNFTVYKDVIDNKSSHSVIGLEQIEKLKQKITEASKESDQANKERKKLEKQLEILNKEKEDLESKVQKLKESETILNSKLGSEKEKAEMQSSSISDLNSQKTILEERISSLEKDVKQKQEANSKPEEQLYQKTLEAKHLEEESRRMEDLMNEINAMNISIAMQNKNLHSSFSNLGKEYAEMESRLNSMSKSVVETREKHESEKQRADKLQSESDAKDEEMKKINDKLSELRGVEDVKTFENLSNRFEQGRKSLESIIQRSNTLRDENVALREKMEKKQEEVKELEAKVSDLEEKVETLTGALKITKEENSRIQSLLKEEQDRNSTSINNIHKLEEKVTARDTKISDMEKDVALMKAENGSLKNQILFSVRGALHMKKIKKENLKYKIELEKDSTGLIGDSSLIKELRNSILRYSQSEIPVFITGETGTGKELVAEAIHKYSNRSSKRYIAVNCGGLTPTLVESELFGHEQGAFTGAVKTKHGFFEVADGGTIFLDEIADFPINLQSKILRVLDNGEYNRVGDSLSHKSDVRVISATNMHLESMVQEGKFRQDLYYRLKGAVIKTPSLREHRQDIPVLVHYFLGDSNYSITPEAIEKMQSYSWPGNVRELKMTVSMLKGICSKKIITARNFLDFIQKYEENTNEKGDCMQACPFDGVTYAQFKEDVDKQYFGHLLKKHKMNISKTANEAGIDRKNLRDKIRQLGLYDNRNQSVS